jgi:hypothetical protein
MAMAAAATTSVVINRAAGTMLQQQQQQQRGVVAMSYGSFCSGRLSSSCTHLSGGSMCREEEVQRRRARRGSAAAAGCLRIRMQQSSSPSVFSSDQVCLFFLLSFLCFSLSLLPALFAEIPLGLFEKAVACIPNDCVWVHGFERNQILGYS